MAKYQFEIQVTPAYVADQSDPAHNRYCFTYTIVVANTGMTAAQLISRHWIIHDALGQQQEVKGLGVVGEQPLLRPGEAFQYTSGCQLQTATGTMQGSYFCVAEDGARFDVPIPIFVLEAEPEKPAYLH